MYLISGCIWHVIHAVWNTISWSHKSCAVLLFFVDQKKSSVTHTKDSFEKQSAKITRFGGNCQIWLIPLVCCYITQKKQKKPDPV
jgi:hypothetical protein